MAKNAIRLDRTKPFSTCHGERGPNDPHYKVHFFQNYKVGKKMVLLPFDAHDNLVPDDGRTEPWIGGQVDGNPWYHHPLYDNDMRALVKKLEEKMPEPEDEDDEPVIAGTDNEAEASKGVDLRAWLRGELQLTMAQVRAAVRGQKGLNPQNYKEAIEFLVLDEKMIPDDQLAEGLRRHIGK